MASRAPANRAEANRATLKSLVKVEANKSCGDCKRNKHPRWASWNLGVFVCIRCSGIHRSMGVHISKVKSVDLDTWTDEQTQSMLRWGNARANKYWEAKLAPGHVPSETKIDNFIRTKYDSKRWVMDGPMPDPATLGGDGDDVPLNVVQEKAKLAQPVAQQAAATASRIQRAPVRDLFGDDDPIPRSTSGPPSAISKPPSQVQASAPAPAPRQTKPADSLLGLDFFGDAPAAAPPRSASAAPPSSGSAGISRPDLKQSILSLYASSSTASSQPKPQPQSNNFGFMAAAPPQNPANNGLGGLQDSFGGLNFGGPAPAAAPAVIDPFASFGQSSRTAPSKPTAQPAFGGSGGFFDAPKPTTSAAPAQQRSAAPATFTSNSNALGDLGDLLGNDAFSSPPATQPAANNSYLSSGFGQPMSPVAPSTTSTSAFNLSNRTPAPAPSALKSPTMASSAQVSSADVWGSSDVWGAPEPAPKPAAAAAAPSNMMNNDFGSGGFSSNAFGAPTPKAGPPDISADEDFGGWSSAPVESKAAVSSSRQAPAAMGSGSGNAGSDDLFSNVWG